MIGVLEGGGGLFSGLISFGCGIVNLWSLVVILFCLLFGLVVGFEGLLFVGVEGEFVDELLQVKVIVIKSIYCCIF